MPLINSISGLRGTIGGVAGDNLTPIDIVAFSSAFARWAQLSKASVSEKKTRICVGRDARISGVMVRDIVVATLQMAGIDVIDLGITTTPTLAFSIPREQAAAGIMITASHNPREWNALKFLDSEGEFIAPEIAACINDICKAQDFLYASVDALGSVKDKSEMYLKAHIHGICNYHLVQVDNIAACNFSVLIDGINSSGAHYVPALLRALGVQKIQGVNTSMDGDFAHNPEPLPANLQATCEAVKKAKVDIGIVVDPDVDRLCFIDENGNLFGEEYTLVAICDYVLAHTKTPLVHNLLSSRALRDVAEKYGVLCYASRVGERNVVEMMKQKKALIGGEGSGGVIVADFHYGRDALIGIGLFLSLLADKKMSVSTLRASYPSYSMVKEKISPPENAVESLARVKKDFLKRYADCQVDETEGLKISLDEEKAWVCVRASNTEPIWRVYSEAKTEKRAQDLVCELCEVIAQK